MRSCDDVMVVRGGGGGGGVGHGRVYTVGSDALSPTVRLGFFLRTPKRSLYYFNYCYLENLEALKIIPSLSPPSHPTFLHHYEV